jgi:hypothetical protein
MLFLFVLQHQQEYQEILTGVKGDDQCKKLASQFIARYLYLPYAVSILFTWDT